MEVKRNPDNKTQTDLTNDFKPSFKAFLIFLFNLDIIIYKSDASHPNRRDDKKKDIDVIEFGKQQYGHNGCQNDDETSHSRRASFFFLTFQA